MLPISLFTSGSGLGSAGSTGHKRNKPLLLGLPALIVAVVAVSAIGSVQFLSTQSLEDDYLFRFDEASSQLSQLTKTLSRKQRVKSIDGGVSEGVTDEDRKELQKLRDAQKIYLDKLITIAPDNDAYRFDLARLVASRGDGPHALSILNELAPEDAPGYPDAHFVLAQNSFEKPAKTAMELSSNLSIALKHIDHVLTRDEKNMSAKLLKARVLTRNQRYEAAYDLYDELFEKNPNYYLEMVKINERLERDDRNRRLYERAFASFEQLAAKPEVQEDDRRWIVVETGIARTLQNLKRYADAENRLEGLIQKYSADPKGGPRRVFLERILAGNYISWASEIADANTPYDSLSADVLEDLLDKYTKSYRNYPDNVNTLQALARLSLSSNREIAQSARKVYDPMKDEDAPSAVLNQLGNHALMSKNFKEAIRQYERARSKAPLDPAILNNLSYSYLVAEDSKENAERALKLINEAIQNLPKDLDEGEVSKFLHTKATALKQQDRLQEALAVYERALRARPYHGDTLRSLIECYRGLNKLPPEQYIARLEEIEASDRRDTDVVTP